MTVGVLKEVLAERERQDRKWGQQNHDLARWGLILSEEVGEFSQAALEATVRGSSVRAAQARTELIQVAAVAVAIVECMDRQAAKAWEPLVPGSERP